MDCGDVAAKTRLRQDLKEAGAKLERWAACERIDGIVERYDAFQRQVWQVRVAFGDRFLAFLITNYLGLKGAGLVLVSTAMLPFFKAQGISGDIFQLASMAALTPWAMKGFIGVLSDCLPLGRYHKRGYLVASSALGVAGSTGLLALPTLGLSGNVPLVTALFFLINVQSSTFDLLCEGKYAEIMRQRGSGAEIVSLVWVCVNLGGLFAALMTLMLVDSQGAMPLIALTVPCALISFLQAARGDLPEEPVRRSSTKSTVQWAKMQSEPWLFAVACFMAFGALSVAASAALFTSRGQVVVVLVSSLAIQWMSFQALPRTLARSNLYMFLVSAAYVDLSGPLGYYYTSGPDCVPGGPDFSYGYYLAVTNIVGNVGGIVGSLLFQGMQTWSFRKAFWLTTLVQILASVFDIVIVNRWNLDWGLSDQATFLFGDAACQPIASMLALMPSALLNSRLCPRGAEATVYAVLAGSQNFGGNVASVLGVWLARELQITANADTSGCDFSHLTTALVIAHVCLPITCIPLTFWLIPDARLDDETAFEMVSPPPSFCSPASSPASSTRSSPRGSPAASPLPSHAPYSLLVGEDLVSAEEALPKDFFMTGFSRTTSPCT